MLLFLLVLTALKLQKRKIDDKLNNGSYKTGKYLILRMQHKK